MLTESGRVVVGFTTGSVFPHEKEGVHKKHEGRCDERAEVVFASEVVTLERPVKIRLALDPCKRVTAEKI